MRRTFASANDAPGGHYFSDISSGSRDVIKPSVLTVRKAMFYLHYKRSVSECRTVQQQVSISYITGMRVVLAAKSLSYA